MRPALYRSKDLKTNIQRYQHEAPERANNKDICKIQLEDGFIW